jgi:hypothetical protein
MVRLHVHARCHLAVAHAGDFHAEVAGKMANPDAVQQFWRNFSGAHDVLSLRVLAIAVILGQFRPARKKLCRSNNRIPRLAATTNPKFVVNKRMILFFKSNI